MLLAFGKQNTVNNSIEPATHVNQLVGCHVRYDVPIIGAISGTHKGILEINGIVERIDRVGSAPVAVIAYNSKYGIKTYDYPLASWVMSEAQVS